MVGHRIGPRALLGAVLVMTGCRHPEITAVSLNPAPMTCGHHGLFCHDSCKEPEGIPFYLPKPLLVISKNFRNIEEAKVGLTDPVPIPGYFDDQAKYADLNARTNFVMPDGGVAQPAAGAVPASAASPTPGNFATISPTHIYSPGGAPVTPGTVSPDGLKPEAFYTYHIIFVPDLTQKYGLKIKGGAGEIRAAMNLVNGWQFTGLGPYYMKDSSTAQNTLAGGITANLAASGVADVVKSVAALRGPVTSTGTGSTQSGLIAPQVALDAEKIRALADAMVQLQPKFVKIEGYAEINIYEPYLSPEGTMEWKPIIQHVFDRDVVQSGFAPQDVMKLLQSAASAPAANQAETQDVPANPASANPSPFKPREVQGTGTGTPILPGPAPYTPVIPGTGTGTPPIPKPATGEKKASDMVPDILPLSNRRRSSGMPVAATNPNAGRDAAVVRAEFDTSQDLDNLSALGDATLPGMRLDPRSDSDTPGDCVTSVANPVFRVNGAPPNSSITLYRDHVKVNELQTGPTVSGEVAIPDNTQGALPAGVHQYEAFATRGGKRIPLGIMPLQIVSPSAPAPETVVAAPIPSASPAASLERDMVQQMMRQSGAFGAVPSAPPAPAPTAANQVNLNQYFGKGAGPKVERTGKRFSLFHHKKAKPVIRDVQLTGVSSDAFVAPTMAEATTSAPSAGPPTVIPGTGVGAVTQTTSTATAPSIPGN